MNSDRAEALVRELLDNPLFYLGSYRTALEQFVQFYEVNQSLIADLYDRVNDLENQLDELRE